MSRKEYSILIFTLLHKGLDNTLSLDARVALRSRSQRGVTISEFENVIAA
jgi:hypothetical protein